MCLISNRSLIEGAHLLESIPMTIYVKQRVGAFSCEDLKNWKLHVCMLHFLTLVDEHPVLQSIQLRSQGLT